VRWGLARGEAVVASLGVVLGVVIVGVLAASSWWTLRTYRVSLERGREQQVRTAVGFVADQATELLTDRKVNSAKKLMVKASQDADLQSCRVVLPDGKVLVDSDPKTKPAPLTVQTLRAERAEGQQAVTLERQGTDFKATMPISVLGIGPCTVEAVAVLKIPAWADADVQFGIGAVGLLGMGGLLGTYRLMRRRLRGLGAIGDALRCVARGQTSSHALHVSESFGEEARAWNMFLAQRDALRDERAIEQAAEKLATRAQGAGGGDLAAACDALWSGFVILDSGGIVRYANGAAAVLLRRKREELMGAPVSQAFDDAGTIAALAGVASGKTRQRMSVEFERKDPGQSRGGDRTTLRLTARPLRRDDNTQGSASAILLIEDVTQQRVADESRNAFVAQATHELRTPLTNIRLYVETMVEDGESDPAIRSKCINVIGQEARRLERIVADMLSVSEIEAGSLKLNAGEVRLDALFEELEADFKAQAEDKEIKLVFELPPKYPLMRADRDKLLLALSNLVGNALKYTPAGGAVTVRVEAGHAGNLVVDVVDNGIGISEQEQELVFEKFYRAKDRRIAGITGSGIGLPLARQVARLHGGEVSVKSQIDKGSTFTLSVPLMPQSSAATPASPATATAQAKAA
jgi:signal transduction histidine kinase